MATYVLVNGAYQESIALQVPSGPALRPPLVSAGPVGGGAESRLGQSPSSARGASGRPAAERRVGTRTVTSTLATRRRPARRGRGVWADDTEWPRARPGTPAGPRSGWDEAMVRDGPLCGWMA